MRTLRLAIVMAAITAAGAEETALRIYYIGNSLTDELKYGEFAALAQLAGERVVWGRHMIPGAPIRWMWGATNGFTERPFGPWTTALREFEWDVVTLQPFNPFESEFPHAQRFCEEIARRSPAAEVLIYAQWPGRRRGADWELAFAGPERTARARAADPNAYAVRAAAAPPPWRELLAERSLRNEYELIVVSLNAERAMRRPVRLIPAGHVMQLLAQKMRAGMMPGYRTPWDFYSDGIHVNNDGSYLVACTFFATIFRRSPVGLPVAGYQGRPGLGADGVKISPETARTIQETVWEVVATHPLSGVTSSAPLRVATPALGPAVAGEPYRMELLPAFGRGPYEWATIGATLPAGLMLTRAGVITGTAVEATRAELLVRVADAAGATATAHLALVVEPDRAPTIPEQPMPELALGEFVEHRLYGEGGNGVQRWSVAEGERLPPGLTLDPDGRLWGAPGREGRFEFTVVAEDGDSARPERAQRRFAVLVGAARREIARARRLASAPAREALVTERTWCFQYPIHKRVEGEATTVGGRFDVAWTAEALYVAVRVEDSTNDRFPGGSRLRGDHVILCLDAFNNRESAYNADDRYLPYPRGQRYPHRETMIGPALGHACHPAELEGGYLAVFEVSWKGLGLPLPMEPGRTIGLDVMLVDGAGEQGARSVVVWQGTKDNATDPSRFGTVVLEE
ncbi:MAG: putative Ig domain-containing protein [Kiritimatiellae bacterium]|nr:putative Ig domain-containing protein [Kiritimatiellia bacterium]